jgi:hypothetical protein
MDFKTGLFEKLIHKVYKSELDKSTIATFLHAMLKMHGVTSEYTAEYAKDLAWEGRLDLAVDDLKLFGEQQHRQFRLKGKVDCIISDSPLLLSSIYRTNDNLLNALVLQEFNKYENINFYVIRKKKYIRRGRKEGKKEATKIDKKTRGYLDHNQIGYTEVEGSWDGALKVLEIVLKRLNIKQQYPK